ncbi:hypothetical protein [Jiangella asiatica]|uniref:Asp23/Gls24 family envelope stress response protein n=1 Tax=Jiangella asiatica TaxID=2530372 RepID=A0A4R5DGR3_9ACTN|nr:hypothetical protein [Jiangella asiatica]TDE09623.1 hypothetical protein E1269_13365 [Jiangella asiatica]
MEMSADPDGGRGAGAPPGRGDVAPPDTAVVDRAASALRAYTDYGWPRAAQRILATVLTATRRARPVRARGEEGDFRVSDQVVTSYLQEAIDRVDGIRVTHIRLDLDGNTLVALHLTVAVTYPERIAPLADAVRRAARDCVRSIIGDVDTPLDLRHIQVHVGDVRPPTGRQPGS